MSRDEAAAVPQKSASDTKRSLSRKLSRRQRHGLDAPSSDNVDKKKKKESTAFACFAAIFTLGTRPLLQWIWRAEDTYGPGDPRRVLINRHTDRLKKIFLLLGGVFALCEAVSLGFMTPQFHYCAPTCKTDWAVAGRRRLSEVVPTKDQVSQGASALKGQLDSVVCLPDKSAFDRASVPAPSSPPATPPPPKLPDIGISLDDSDKALAQSIRDVYRHQLLSIRVSINASVKMPSDDVWTCLDGSLGFTEIIRAEVAKHGENVSEAEITATVNEYASDASFLLDLPITPRLIFSTLMLVTVVLWFVLRSALFNVIKGRRLCKCRCCPKLSAFVQSANKKFLNLLCPLALNMIMVLSNGLLL